jgi:hypothetical protein
MVIDGNRRIIQNQLLRNLPCLPGDVDVYVERIKILLPYLHIHRESLDAISFVAFKDGKITYRTPRSREKHEQIVLGVSQY